MKKTYIAPGLLEWQMRLRVDGAIIPIRFTRGSMGTNGIIGARFTTTNTALQKIIERSPQFRGKRIKRIDF